VEKTGKSLIVSEIYIFRSKKLQNIVLKNPQ
jgi:hypothetical protein